MMLSKIGNAQLEKKIIESTYEDVCNVFNLKKVKVAKETQLNKVLLYSNISCALSKKSKNITNQTEAENKFNYTHVIYLAPDINISTGSIIEVTQYGKTYEVDNTSVPLIYPTHQEISCNLKGFA